MSLKFGFMRHPMTGSPKKHLLHPLIISLARSALIYSLLAQRGISMRSIRSYLVGLDNSVSPNFDTDG
jgi:hypothetical protein